MALRVLVVGMALVLAACTGEAGPEGPAGPIGPAGPTGAQGPPGDPAEIDVTDLSCTECHNDTTIIWSKEAQFREVSVHGTGEAFVRGESGSCAGCHGHEGAKARIAAGLAPRDPSVEAVVNVSPYDCRTCHNIHTTYTGDDWSLTGNQQPVTLAMTGGTFDNGAGNLCANCHQIRNELPDLSEELILLETTRFGTHYGAEAQMLLGEGGLDVPGRESPHYTDTDDGCVTCHMGEERNHTYQPDVERCQACHEGLETFDNEGIQTEVQALLDEVKALLINSGIMRADYEEEGEIEHDRSIEGEYPREVVAAMWNYMFVLNDDSRGVHNPDFALALLRSAKASLEGS